MISTFKTGFRLRNTYKANSVIYSLKQIPIIKKLLPDRLYASPGLKTFADIAAVLWELLSVFLGKFLYLLFMVSLMSGLMKTETGAGFSHILLFLSFIGAFMNTNLFNPTKDKYYGIALMNMDAREYVVSNYLYFLIKMIVGFMPFMIWFGTKAGVSLPLCILYPFFIVGFKLVISACVLRDYEKHGKARNENNLPAVAWITVALLLAAAYGPPIWGYALDERIVWAAGLSGIVLGAACLVYVLRFRKYSAMCRKMLGRSSVIFNTAENKREIMQGSYQKKIDITAEAESGKSGFAYFHDLFMKRHRKILIRSSKRTAAILLLLWGMTAAACLIKPELGIQVNGLMLTILPYFMFVMYLTNRGKVVSQAMFMNCDHSMLTYRFYRQPHVILSLFRERLKSVIWLNLPPTLVLAAGLPLLLYLTGGTDQYMNYAILFVSILFMSVFFSVHNLVLYYLLQPYNVEIEMKSMLYSIADGVTYLVCYVLVGKRIPVLLFGVLVIVFCAVYIVLALILVYRYAPKTFRLRR
ncbi:hypothetical protein LQE92_12985 [Lacrimispora sp. NSJ-141]|uniref:Uncharacterized protein n=1 Tax=Lientehia hominis TaxID=2897778 RepID=A0AAP2RLP8_9FIRM|nr:hypothetical protein [Lientehia hominis]MCD2493530.1 hypothetical protein [Lientehia hominis]